MMGYTTRAVCLESHHPGLAATKAPGGFKKMQARIMNMHGFDLSDMILMQGYDNSYFHLCKVLLKISNYMQINRAKCLRRIPDSYIETVWGTNAYFVY
jgi:hypothetical protein